MRARVLASIVVGFVAVVSPLHAAFEYQDRLDLPVTGYNGPDDGFGAGIEAANGSVLVSAPADAWPESHERGSIFSFVRRNGTWGVEDIVRPEPDACDLGERLVADGNDAYALVRTCAAADAEPLANGHRSWIQRMSTSGDGRWHGNGLMPADGLPAGQDVLRFDAFGGTFAALAGDWNVPRNVRLYVYDAASGQHEVLDPDAFGVADVHALSVAGDRMALAYGARADAMRIALLERVDGTWRVTGGLLDPDAPSASYFGRTVLLRGADLFVGATSAGDPERLTGAVHHYRRTGAGQWTQRQRIAPPDGHHAEMFGEHMILSASGDELVVVAPAHNWPPGRASAEALYRYCLTTHWVPCGRADAVRNFPPGKDDVPAGTDAAFAEGDLLFADAAAVNSDGTGGTISIRRRDAVLGIADTFHPGYGGHRALFGARVAFREGLAAAASSGRIDVYVQQGTAWLHDAALSVAPLDPGAYCPASDVAIGSDYIVAARACDRNGLSQHGLVVFRRSATGWTRQPVALPPDEAPGSTAYTRLVVSGDRVYYALPHAPGAASSNVGKVLVFDPSTSTWGTPITPPAPIADDFFGMRLHADDRRLLVGTRSQVHVYATASAGAPQLQASLLRPPMSFPTGIAGWLGDSAAFGERSIFVSDPSAACPDQAEFAGVIHELRQAGNGWEYGNMLCKRRLIPSSPNGWPFTLAESNGALLVGYAGPGQDTSFVAELRRKAGQWQAVATIAPEHGHFRSQLATLPLVATGRLLLVGVPGEPHVDTATSSGAVFAFMQREVFTGGFEAAE